jgi:hypothetical protein
MPMKPGARPHWGAGAVPAARLIFRIARVVRTSPVRWG